MKISVIILCWNGEEFIGPCLEALLAQADQSVEVMVVDNASIDSSVSLIRQYESKVRLIQNDFNFGFSGGNNIGLKAATGEVLILLNQDTIIQPQYLSIIAETCRNKGIGIVGCKALYPDGQTIQHAGGEIMKPSAFTRHFGQHKKNTTTNEELMDVDYVTGAALAIQRETYHRIGGLDEGFYPALYEDVDYCYRARRAGFRVVYQPCAAIIHREAGSMSDAVRFSYLIGNRSRMRFVLRHWSFSDLQAFFSEEHRVIESSHDVFLLETISQAYLANLRDWPSISESRQRSRCLGEELSRGQISMVFEGLRKLYLLARSLLLQKKTSPTVLHPERFPRISQPPTSLEISTTDQQKESSEALDEVLAILQKKAQLLENPRPTARSKLFGPMVTRLRAFWLAVFVRPYLIPILYQQNYFNETLASVIKEFFIQQRDLDRREGILAEHCQEITQYCQAITQQQELLQTDILTLAKVGHSSKQEDQQVIG